MWVNHKICLHLNEVFHGRRRTAGLAQAESFRVDEKPEHLLTLGIVGPITASYQRT